MQYCREFLVVVIYGIEGEKSNNTLEFVDTYQQKKKKREIFSYFNRKLF